MYPLNVSDAVSDALSPQDSILFTRFGFGATQKAPFTCVHHAFEHYARRQSDTVAVVHCDSSITYADLDRKANGLANRLRNMGVHPGSRVCLLVQRSVHMVVGILGILKAGAAYVPLDGSMVTQSTLEYVIHDSQSILVLALQEFLPRVAHFPAVCLEETIKELSPGECSKPEDLSSPDDGVYIIYTSGMLRCCVNSRSVMTFT